MNSQGTFTNFAQTDQILCELHYYLMYLKLDWTSNTSQELNQAWCFVLTTVEQAKYRRAATRKNAMNHILDYFEICTKSILMQ